MKNDKLMYVLIIIGIFIVLGLGINIGLSMNKEKPQEIDLYKEVEKLSNKSNKPVVNNENEVSTTNEKNEPKKEEVISIPSKSTTSNTSTSTKTNTTTKSSNTTKSTTSTNVSKSTNTTNTTNTTKSNDVSNNSVSSSNDNVTNVEEPKFSLKDNVVVNKLTETYENVKTSVVDGTFKDKGKATFVSIVDFLFYDGTIDGVTFKELTGKGKEKALELASKIDNAIEKRAPGYKDTISDKKTKVLNKASELIKKGTTSLDNFLRNKLNSEDYNELIRAKNELVTNTKYAVSFIKENGSKIINSAIDKLDKWYQVWKNK